MHPLDDCIWEALGAHHARFGVQEPLARRYLPDVAPFAAVADPEQPDAWRALARLLPPGSHAALFQWTLPRPDAVVVRRSRPLVQMALERQPLGAPPLEGRCDLSSENANEMIALVKLTEPGPMERRTVELGHYVGVRDAAGQLIAMAGERMRPPGWTEISAICVHPDHRGKGLARRLTELVAAGIAARGERSFLHVAEDNAPARSLYLSMGFVERRAGHVVVVSRAA